MRIAAGSDFHTDQRMDMGGNMMVAVAEGIRQSGADVVVVAGDICAFSSELFDITLSYFDSIEKPKIAVLGNHDIWVPKEGQGDSWQKIKELEGIYHRHGFHLLDTDGPAVIGDVAFAGNMGWYDYSFFQRDGPFSDTSVVAGKREVLWKDMDDEALGEKFIRYAEGKQMRGVGWNDINYARFGASDKDVLEPLLERLRGDIESVYGKADKVVAVTHHVPFEEFVLRKNNIGWSFNNAFIGSKRIGELLQSYEKVGVSVFGHIHSGKHMDVGRIRCYDASVRPYRPSPHLIDV